MKKLLAIALGIAVSTSALAGACNKEEAKTLVDIAVESETPTFTTLASLLGAFGLVEPFSGNRNFTVFAPTDEAFAEIAAVIPTLTQDQIAEVLSYHVTQGARDPEEVFSKDKMKMLNYQFVELTTAGGAFVNDAEVIASVEACNGWVHVVNKVLIPEFSD